MNRFHEFSRGEPLPAAPPRFPSPFSSSPAPLALRAAAALQHYLGRYYPALETAEGKMFGVLVVAAQDGQLGYLAGFSGMLDACWELPGFVPPVFSVAARSAFLSQGEQALKALTKRIAGLCHAPALQALEKARDRTGALARAEIARCAEQHRKDRQWRRQQREHLSCGLDTVADEAQLAALSRQSQQNKRQKKELKRFWERRIADLDARLEIYQQEIALLEAERKALSQSLQQQVFDGYVLKNVLGESKPLKAFFRDGMIPGGAGDCAGPKLIHYAIGHGMKPLAMAEFWWGRGASSAVRHHAQFYPACRGKCRPILPFMLRGIDTEPEPQPFLLAPDAALDVVYQDDALMLINKPAGLLSTPGKSVSDAVQTRLQNLVPDATGPLLVHRLDLATSGLLLVALRPKVHKALQQQFIARTIKKRYVAILDGIPFANEGLIDLPLRVDLNDRPRQVVCRQYGKKAITRWCLVSRKGGKTRVYFFPSTGRTHQLRVHAAHPDGLNAPIVGDELYGKTPAQRMMLHAERLGFVHPVSGEWREFTVAAPF